MEAMEDACPIPVIRRGRAARSSAFAAAVASLLVLGDPLTTSAALVSHGSRDAPVVALTFDDGYDPAAIASIVATLDRTGVRATFFPTSGAVRATPDLWRRVAAVHPIGNHSIDHPDLTTLGRSAVRRQITVSRAQIEDVIGRPQIPFLRPPYGAWNGMVREVAREAGYRAIVLWDVDTNDWRRPTMARLVRDATSGRNGSIILMHTLPGTARALDAIIASYRDRGFRFVTVPELFGAGAGAGTGQAAGVGAAVPAAVKVEPPLPDADAIATSRVLPARSRFLGLGSARSTVAPIGGLGSVRLRRSSGRPSRAGRSVQPGASTVRVRRDGRAVAAESRPPRPAPSC
jgi:peptidoglycan/xylan/chitin deacetylase (PgdA/CDA1 family)